MADAEGASLIEEFVLEWLHTEVSHEAFRTTRGLERGSTVRLALKSSRSEDRGLSEMRQPAFLRIIIKASSHP